MMAFLAYLCALVFFACAVTDGFGDVTTTPKYVSYNSSDLSYLSNGIQFQVQAIPDEPIAPETSSTDLPEMQWLARLYDHHGWDKRLDVLTNQRCKDDMESYVHHLRNGTLWAAKSEYILLTGT